MTVARGYSDPARVAARAAALGARTIGRSVDGRPLLAIELGRGDRVSLVLGGIHPIEWIGVEVALALAERIAAAPPADRRVVIVPVINVDGHAQVGEDVAAGRRRYHRTNRRGVDLNRNFPIGHLAAGARKAGVAAWSEPETAAIAALAAGVPIDRAVALHAFGRMILLPWAHRGATSPQHRELVAHARAIAGQLSQRAGRYRVLHTGRWPLFRPGGLELDWLTARGALTMLVECGRGGLSWREPSTWIEPFRWYNPANPEAEVDALATALESFVRGGTPGA
ncbi:MAG TPA: M14 family zinc carboxypeptidase [Kofleriaceae bacterium]|nr:M14 family zinc carboxypeptidase [Kofleriaceae bacterium]